jgi:hypothetical protein
MAMSMFPKSGLVVDAGVSGIGCSCNPARGGTGLRFDIVGNWVAAGLAVCGVDLPVAGLGFDAAGLLL